MDDKPLKLSSQICFPIYTASRLITKVYKPFLDEMGITYPQYLVLMVLWENDAISVNQISKELRLNTNTLSPLLQRMEKMKLLERNRSSKDERSVIVRLSESGKQLKTKALPIPEKLLSELISENLKIEDMLKLKDVLNELISVLTEKNNSNNQIKL